MFFPDVPALAPRELDPAAPIPEGWTVLDVREPDEWEGGRIPGSLHIPLGEVPERLDDLPADGQLLVVCHSGGRSARAAAWLNHNGFDAVNLDGGIVDWVRAGLPVETG